MGGQTQWTRRARLDRHIAAVDRSAIANSYARYLELGRFHGTEDTVIGIDAPIVIPNASGMREVDKLAHVKYGRYHAGCYPASRERSYWRRTTGLSRELRNRGFQHGDQMPARSTGRFQIEVHPHAASVQLHGLDRIVKYKRGTLAIRRAGLARLRTLMLERLPRLIPSLPIPGLPDIPEAGASKPRPT